MSAPADISVTREQFSAGGVAYRGDRDDVRIVIVFTVAARKWQLPKGIIDPGESAREAAVREVREEGGIETELVGDIGQTEYSFTVKNNGIRQRIQKSVHWFLLRYSGGAVEDHDHEVEEARWVNVQEALRLLEFENEREIVRKAVSMISRTSAPD